jgi:hypothetical protein
MIACRELVEALREPPSADRSTTLPSESGLTPRGARGRRRGPAVVDDARNAERSSAQVEQNEVAESLGRVTSAFQGASQARLPRRRRLRPSPWRSRGRSSLRTFGRRCSRQPPSERARRTCPQPEPSAPSRSSSQPHSARPGGSPNPLTRSFAVVLVVSADPELPCLAFVAAFRCAVQDRVVAHEKLQSAPRR